MKKIKKLTNLNPFKASHILKKPKVQPENSEKSHNLYEEKGERNAGGASVKSNLKNYNPLHMRK